MKAEVGDVVKIQQRQEGILAPVIKAGKRLLEAEVVDVDRAGPYDRYKVRLQDGSIQTGNGHMIREVVRQE
jgi:hypothetical protein